MRALDQPDLVQFQAIPHLLITLIYIRLIRVSALYNPSTGTQVETSFSLVPVAYPLQVPIH